MNWKCHCGEVNPEDLKICKACGTKFSEEFIANASNESADDSNMQNTENESKLSVTLKTILKIIGAIIWVIFVLFISGMNFQEIVSLLRYYFPVPVVAAFFMILLYYFGTRALRKPAISFFSFFFKKGLVRKIKYCCIGIFVMIIILYHFLLGIWI